MFTRPSLSPGPLAPVVLVAGAAANTAGRPMARVIAGSPTAPATAGGRA